MEKGAWRKVSFDNDSCGRFLFLLFFSLPFWKLTKKKFSFTFTDSHHVISTSGQRILIFSPFLSCFSCSFYSETEDAARQAQLCHVLLDVVIFVFLLLTHFKFCVHSCTRIDKICITLIFTSRFGFCILAWLLDGVHAILRVALTMEVYHTTKRPLSFWKLRETFLRTSTSIPTNITPMSSQVVLSVECKVCSKRTRTWGGIKTDQRHQTTASANWKKKELQKFADNACESEKKEKRNESDCDYIVRVCYSDESLTM